MVTHFSARTSKGFDEFRRDLDSALCRSFGAGVMRWSWGGYRLQITAPGAVGWVTFDEGAITAEIKMSFPATLMEEKITADIRQMLAYASSQAVSEHRR